MFRSSYTKGDCLDQNTLSPGLSPLAQLVYSSQRSLTSEVFDHLNAHYIPQIEHGKLVEALQQREFKCKEDPRSY